MNDGGLNITWCTYEEKTGVGVLKQMSRKVSLVFTMIMFLVDLMHGMLVSEIETGV